MYRFFLIVLFCCLLGPNSTAWAGTYHVAVGGDDGTGTGSSVFPRATIIITSRDGGTTVQLAANVIGAAADWFVNTATGDLHLRSERSGVTGSALTVTGLTDDFDKQSRPLGTGGDIGADEYSLTVPDKDPPGHNTRPTLSWLLLLTGSTL